MDKWYELWDSKSSNLVGEFDSQEQALFRVHQIYELTGPESVYPLVLTFESDQGVDPEIVAAGRDLIELIRPPEAPSQATWMPAGNVTHDFTGNVLYVSVGNERVHFRQNFIRGSVVASSDEPVAN